MEYMGMERVLKYFTEVKLKNPWIKVKTRSVKMYKMLIIFGITIKSKNTFWLQNKLH